MLYQADEVLDMLSTQKVKSLHRAFLSRNGALNFDGFVEVGHQTEPLLAMPGTPGTSTPRSRAPRATHD